MVAERVFRKDPNKMSSDGEGFMEAYSSVGRSHGFTEETLNLSMTAKQPPSHDGKVIWFRHEELVDDWVTFTTIEASKRGPLLKSRLIGDTDQSFSLLIRHFTLDDEKLCNEIVAEGKCADAAVVIH